MNIQQMMKQAQQMQKKMQENQEQLEKTEFEGNSGNGLVLIKMMGTGLVKGLTIDKTIIDPEDKEILEDLIIAAFNDARKKLDKASADSMSNATGGLDLKNMKLPF